MKELIIILLFITAAAALFASDDKKNPISKAYIVDVEGNATVFIENKIEDLKKRAVFSAETAVFETEKKSYEAMVLSNGSGIYLDENSHLEIKKFMQEPFTPNRDDLDIEPSISQTRGFIPHGFVAICTPKIVAGSSMIYETPHGKVRLFNNKTTIEVKDNQTDVISVEGELQVEISPNMFKRVNTGEKAILNKIQIVIKNANKEEFDIAVERVTVACNAKKMVYFDITQGTNGEARLKITPIVPFRLPTEFTISPSTIK